MWIICRGETEPSTQTLSSPHRTLIDIQLHCEPGGTIMFISFTVISWPENWKAVTPVGIGYTGQSHTLIIPNSFEKWLQVCPYSSRGTKQGSFYNWLVVHETRDRKKAAVGECVILTIGIHCLIHLIICLIAACTPNFYGKEKSEFHTFRVSLGQFILSLIWLKGWHLMWMYFCLFQRSIHVNYCKFKFDIWSPYDGKSSNILLMTL